MIDDLPAVEGFDADEAARIRDALGLGSEVVSETPDIVFERPRGRRKKRSISESMVSEDTDTDDASQRSIVPPAKLTKRDEREVNDRLANILIGGTGILSLAKPYLQMTDDEAKAISEPLSTYLVRTADTNPIARQVLENYDLLAIVLGVMAYVVRVYHDRQEEVNEQQSQPSFSGCITEFTQRHAGGSQVRESGIIASDGGTGGRI